MVELHGWLTIQECYGDEDKLSQTEIDAIKSEISQILSKQVTGITKRHANGGTYLDALFCANHRTAEVDDIIGVFSDVAKAADGSYGVIYLRDDENVMYYNEFQIFVFKQGKCTKFKDDKLSPCIPQIEADPGLTISKDSY